MRAVTGLVSKRFRHKGRDQAFLACVFFGHGAQEGIAVAGRDHITVGKIEFELAVGVFVIKGVYVPAEVVHAGDHPVDPAEVVQKTTRVVAGLFQLVFRVRHAQRAVFVLAQQKHFGLDAEVHAKAHCGRFLGHRFERRAGIEHVWLAVECVVGRHPRHLRLPRQLDDVIQIRYGGDLVIVRRLAETVERIASIQL